MKPKLLWIDKERICEVELSEKGLVFTDRKPNLKTQGNHGTYHHEFIFNPAESWDHYYMKPEEIVMKFYESVLERAEELKADYAIIREPIETKIPHKIKDWKTGEEKESDCWHDLHLTGIIPMLKTV